MTKKAEMVEGPDAFDRFEKFARAIVRVPKKEIAASTARRTAATPRNRKRKIASTKRPKV